MPELLQKLDDYLVNKKLSVWTRKDILSKCKELFTYDPIVKTVAVKIPSDTQTMSDYWREKYEEEFSERQTLKHQYMLQQDIIHQYQQCYSKLCYRCKVKDKVSKIQL